MAIRKVGTSTVFAQECEEWRPVLVEGFEDAYEVSNLGRVRSLTRTVYTRGGRHYDYPGKILSSQVNAQGYCRARLCRNGGAVDTKVHHLVATAFIGCAPGPVGNRRGEYVINHKDGNKLNNAVSNLEWVTNRENSIHAIENGLKPSIKGERHHKSKLTEDDVRAIRTSYVPGRVRQADLATQYGVTQVQISSILRGESWAHVK